MQLLQISARERIQALLQGIGEEHRGVLPILEQYGDFSLSRYAHTFGQNGVLPVQPREDLIGVVVDYAAELLGERLGRGLRRQLERAAVVLTANHHGVEYAPLCLQGIIIYSMMYDFVEDNEGVIPIFAYGTVPLNNPTFPRGMLLARRKGDGRGDVANSSAFLKVNLFADKYKRTMVSSAPALRVENVQRALQSAGDLRRQGVLSAAEFGAIEEILEVEYLRSDVLEQGCYSNQAVLLNAALWKRLFHSSLQARLPQVAYLEMEKIVNRLLLIDLVNVDSLAYQVLFVPHLRTAVIGHLNGFSGCWDIQVLDKFVTHPVREEEETPVTKKSTLFFWGIDRLGRRVHLNLLEVGGEVFLVGVDDEGFHHQYACTPEGILTGIREQRLLPGLFFTLMIVGFSRGFRCFGGAWQVTYLPQMQRGFVAALRYAGYHEWAEQVAGVPTENFVACTTPILARYPQGVSAAGAVEIAAQGGLTAADLGRLEQLRLADVVPFFLLKEQDFWGWGNAFEREDNVVGRYIVEHTLTLPTFV